MDGQRILKFSGSFYLRSLGLGLLLWVAINLLVGNSPFQGQYYVPAFLLLFLFFQFTYKLDVHSGDLLIWRFGTSSKVGLDKLVKHQQEKGKLIIYLDGGLQYKIPISRFTTEDQSFLTTVLSGVRVINASEEEAQPSIPHSITVKQAKSEIVTQLDAGYSKKAVYESLQGRGVKDAKLAFLIASLPDKMLCALHETKNSILIWVVLAQALLSAWVIYATVNSENVIWMVSITTGVNLLFMWGFYSFKLNAYSLYILLGIISVPRSLSEAVVQHDIGGSIGVVITAVIIAYAWYVRSKLFPCIALVGAKRDKQGRYQFEE